MNIAVPFPVLLLAAASDVRRRGGDIWKNINTKVKYTILKYSYFTNMNLLLALAKPLLSQLPHPPIPTV